MALLSEENLNELLRKALQAKREEEEREGILSGSPITLSHVSSYSHMACRYHHGCLFLYM